ncbi:MAG TPA: hypothetical protein VFM70_03000 [Salinimicrobium sp.]|nr:hypothetical protein [Salinimicrobium sp.]
MYQDIYIMTNYFTQDFLGYKAYFDIKSTDLRFTHDTYFFRIDFPDIDYSSLYSLGKPVNIDSIEVMEPKQFFYNKSNNFIHTELSLWEKENNTRIFIVAEIPSSRLRRQADKSKKHMIWDVDYVGTMKEFYQMLMTKGLLSGD